MWPNRTYQIHFKSRYSGSRKPDEKCKFWSQNPDWRIKLLRPVPFDWLLEGLFNPNRKFYWTTSYIISIMNSLSTSLGKLRVRQHCQIQQLACATLPTLAARGCQMWHYIQTINIMSHISNESVGPLQKLSLQFKKVHLWVIRGCHL